MSGTVTAGLTRQEGRQPTAVGSNGGATVVTGLVCVLLFMSVNPFLALFLLALLTLVYRIPTFAFIVPAAISFTFFFYFRDYGVDWYPGGATDDVPQYIGLYESDYGLSFGDLFTRFIEQPNGHEPLWHLPLWALINGFDASPDTFVFLHYFVIFCAVFIALATVSTRYLAPLALVYFLLIPISLESISFIWRQQLAFSVFLTGVGLYLVRGHRIGRWLIFASPLLHVSSLFFVAVFLVFEYLWRRGTFDNKLKVSIILVAVLLVIPLASSIFIRFLDSIGLSWIMDYFIGSAGVDQVRVYLLMGGYALPQLAAFYALKNDAANNLFMVLCLAVFSVVLALPAANSIYDRLLMFSLPLLALHLFRCLLLNFSPGWRVPALVCVFLIGVGRVSVPARDGFGPGAFLAFGHAFDPAMGLVKMLASF